MKHLLLVILLSTIILGGCYHNTNQENQKHSSGITQQHSGSNDKPDFHQSEDFSLYGLMSSGINISGAYSTISNSGEELLYDNTFVIQLFKNPERRHYNISYSPLYSGYTERLGVENQLNSIAISQYFLSDTEIVYGQKFSLQKICTPDYQEGIDYKPKTFEIKKGDQTYYITYAKFSLMRFEPSDPQRYNYQVELCFARNDKLYNITIGDPINYREDIVESLKFL